MNAFEEVGEEVFELPPVRPGRPLAFTLEFLEFFSGASRVITSSEQYNMKFLHLAAWITHLIAEGILKAVLLEPPWTTFSVMRRPPLRDRIQPFGFDTSDRQTEDGNILAHRSFQIGYVAVANGAIAIIEKPHSSKMKYLPAWGMLLQLASAMLIRQTPANLDQFTRKVLFFGNQRGFETTSPEVQRYMQPRACARSFYQEVAHCIAQGVFQMRQHASATSDVKVEGLWDLAFSWVQAEPSSLLPFVDGTPLSSRPPSWLIR